MDGGREGSEGQSHKDEERKGPQKEGGSGTGEGAHEPLAEEANRTPIGQVHRSSQVPSYATADGTGPT